MQSSEIWSEENPMSPISKTLTTLLGGVVLSLICASTAGASCVAPSPLPQRTLLTPPRPGALAPRLAEGGRLGPAEDKDERHSGRLLDRIVGTWHVTYDGFITGQAFIQWHSDGTEWENINFPILAGNICMGDWKAVDQNHVSRSHVGWLFSDGNPSGSFTMTETDEVARDGSWYRGTNYVRLYDLTGALFAEGAGTAEATRIAAP
jgi:hypothetical protein